ncbi:MAG: hypothetical protein WC050_02310, partial [Candidatus Paceibacterota bacterium]
MAPAPAPAPTPASNPSTPPSTQPQICTPSFSCTDGTMYYQTSSCTKQVYQTCPYGCGTTSCNLSTSTPASGGGTVSNAFNSTSSTSTNTNSNTNTDTSPTPSVSDFLSSYISPRAVDIGTSTSLSFVLNPETGDIEQIRMQSTSTTPRLATNTIESIQPVAGQQTFNSADLASSPGYSYTGPQTSAFFQVLQSMRSALLWGLNVLRSL